jgi:FtsP/CotA-like multicopper oxidase with cupredoxin domain
MKRTRFVPPTLGSPRRRFVQGLAGGALAIVSARHFGWAAAADVAAGGDPGAVLSGTEFNLTIGALPVNYTGEPGIATAVNGRLPAPPLGE